MTLLAKIGGLYLCGNEDCTGTIKPRDIECAFPVTACKECSAKADAAVAAIRSDTLHEVIKTLLSRGIASDEVLRTIREMQ